MPTQEVATLRVTFGSLDPRRGAFSGWSETMGKMALEPRHALIAGLRDGRSETELTRALASVFAASPRREPRSSASSCCTLLMRASSISRACRQRSSAALSRCVPNLYDCRGPLTGSQGRHGTLKCEHVRHV